MSTFVLVAGGPSLTLAQCKLIGIAKQRRSDLSVIAINDSCYPCWFADYVYACDGPWWDYHQGLPGYRGCRIRLRIYDEDGKERNSTTIPGIETFECGGERGLDERPTHITTGRNSGHQALHVAYHLGAQRIVLVGYDFRDFVQHWFGRHPKKIYRNSRGHDWVSLIEMLGGDILAKGREIVNATPGSAITAFPSVDLAEALGVQE